MKIKKITIFLTLLTATIISAFSQDIKYTSKDIRHGTIALGEILTLDLVMNEIETIVFDWDASRINLDSIANNMNFNRWIWDSTSFPRNQFAHPYLGSLYYNCGRANGMNFYESLAGAMLGSWMYESVFHTSEPSINDLITTSFAGSITGEVLHRLFLEVVDYNKFLSFLISPVDGFNYLITNEQPAKSNSSVENIELIFAVSPYYDTNFSFPIFGSAINIEYGNPYEKPVQAPFDAFTLYAEGNINHEGKYNVKLNIESLLYSLCFIPQDNIYNSIAITLSYKNLMTSSVNNSSQTLNAAFFQEITGNNNEKKDLSFAWNLQLGINYFTADNNSLSPKNNYLFGPDVSGEITFSQDVFGKVKINGTTSMLFPFSSNSVAFKDMSFQSTSIIEAEYEHKITSFLSIGIRGLIFLRHSFYTNRDNLFYSSYNAGVYTKLIL